MNMRLVLIGVCILFAVGCAKVRVEAPKEAFKVDISMRLDIYQHVEKDINSIEDLVSGAAQKKNAPGAKNFMNILIQDAYAQEGLGADVEQAALRRRDRKPSLSKYESSGVVGENRLGLVEIRAAGNADAQALVRDENSDRMVIYRAVAQKNSTSVEDVQKLYAKRLQTDAPAGTPIETDAGWALK
jgi:uncharacterized protein YdbL (DUF1318 family)